MTARIIKKIVSTVLVIAGSCSLLSIAQAQLLNEPLYSVYFYPDKTPPTSGNGVVGRAILYLNSSDGINDQWNAVCAPPKAPAPCGTLSLHDSTGGASTGVTFTYPPLYLTGTAVNAPEPLSAPNGGNATEAYDVIYQPTIGQTSAASTFTFSGLTPGGGYDLVVYGGHVPGANMNISVNGGTTYLLTGGVYNHNGSTFVGRVFHDGVYVQGPSLGDYIELDNVTADPSGKLSIALSPADGAPELDVMGFQLQALFTSSSPASGALRLPAVFSNHAVLQADKPVFIWGWAGPGETVTVTFQRDNGQTEQFNSTTGSDGRWSGQLPALPSGAKGQLNIRTDKGKTAKIADVLVGEVWLCSGQSNMDYRAITTERGKLQNTTPEMSAVVEQEATAAQGNIRYFKTHTIRADMPLDDVQGRWVVAAPGTVGDCFSVSWNFAVGVRDKLHCPIGLIDTAVGGTNIEAWMARPELDTSPFGPITDSQNPALKAKFDAGMAEWLKDYPTPDLQQQHLSTKPVMGAERTHHPACLYNGMIHGLEPYALRGFLWFQGDSNEGDWQIYGELSKILIATWRNHWHDDTLAFYYAEQPNYDIPQTQPVEYNKLSLIRETQQGALEMPRTGVAATIDLGIQVAPGKNAPPHFPNKKPLGQRLAGMALNDVYGFPGLVRSPQLKSFQVEGGKIRLKIDYADGLRVRGGDDVKGFALRAANGPWVWATGKIDGQDILIWNDQVPNPVDARYAWAMNPIISVENSAGLPLRPFRTDTKDPQ